MSRWGGIQSGHGEFTAFSHTIHTTVPSILHPLTLNGFKLEQKGGMKESTQDAYILLGPVE